MQLPFKILSKAVPRTKSITQTIVNFLGTLLPIIFPNQKFNPKRLGAVVILTVLLGVSIHFLGVDATESLVDFTGDAIELTEE